MLRVFKWLIINYVLVYFYGHQPHIVPNFFPELFLKRYGFFNEKPHEAELPKLYTIEP